MERKSITELIGPALRGARDTRDLMWDSGVPLMVPMALGVNFGSSAEALIVGDPNTMGAIGDDIAFQMPGARKFVFEDPNLYAEHSFVEQLEAALRQTSAIAIAVGSGTINDITKLASHRVGRQYICVPTAASMDGYTAYGASITYNGSKQTFECPAPQAVVIDTGILCDAPPAMSASGYADLLAKVTAGADWIVADALGVEPIHQKAWDTVQSKLRPSLADPAGVHAGKWEAIELLTAGLLISGLAMQQMESSRCASGAEHQFSHLWDMQHATDASHGFKVGVATIAVARFYEELLEWPMQKLDVDSLCAAWPTRQRVEESVRELFADHPQLRDVALRESLAKHSSVEELRRQLTRLRDVWPELAKRLRAQLLPARELATMLETAGAPIEPQQIGIPTRELVMSFYKAFHIRRRFTVLDLAVRAGVLDEILFRVYPQDDE